MIMSDLESERILEHIFIYIMYIKSLFRENHSRHKKCALFLRIALMNY